ncbi:helix-turn-helix domain-containing protein [Roseibium salinum]|nr:helix-turn-helix domain-containing protein [Roseibium salinum]
MPSGSRIFFLELKARLQLIGKCSGSIYACPLSQSQIADALGLTPAHLNRVLRYLRETNLFHIRHGEVEIVDEEQAALFAQFDGRYLDQNWSPPSSVLPQQHSSSFQGP